MAGNVTIQIRILGQPPAWKKPYVPNGTPCALKCLEDYGKNNAVKADECKISSDSSSLDCSYYEL
jgi:hypothetical protein